MARTEFCHAPVNAAKAVDPEGNYVRRWVPELRGLPSGLIHAPWSLLGTLCSANVRLGGTYCRRFLCDLVRALEICAVMKIRNGIGRNMSFLVAMKRYRSTMAERQCV